MLDYLKNLGGVNVREANGDDFRRMQRVADAFEKSKHDTEKQKEKSHGMELKPIEILELPKKTWWRTLFCESIITSSSEDYIQKQLAVNGYFLPTEVKNIKLKGDENGYVGISYQERVHRIKITPLKYKITTKSMIVIIAAIGSTIIGFYKNIISLF